MAKTRETEAPRTRPRQEQGSRMSVLFSNPEYLLEGFAEKHCQYVGVIEDMPTSADTSNRGYLLAVLDSKRNDGSLPWQLGPENSVTLTISAYNLKIIKDDQNGTLLHRIPIHKIASSSYVNDDNTHLLFIKAGDADNAHCPVHIFVCSKRADAEEVCTLLQQVFQLVYTEATVELLNESITAGEKGFRGSRNSFMLIPKPNSPVQQEQQQPEQFTFPRTLPKRSTPPTIPRTLTEVAEQSEEPTSVSAVELVQGYMEQLHNVLDFQELREFANLLRCYREDLKVEGFLEKLMQLYGPQRRHLIPDMRSFIPEEDTRAFETFLSDNHLGSPPPPAATVPGPTPTTQDKESDENGRENLLTDIDNDITTTNF